jgi:uncharacterized protein (UPF0248 family)
MVRNLLNELLWHPEKSLEGVKIIYIHRGAPDDRTSIDAEKILRLERSHFIIERGRLETWIPYHRIIYVTRGGEILYRKRGY